MRELAQNLGAFREQLLIEEFSEIESFVLTYSFMMTTLENRKVINWKAN